MNALSKAFDKAYERTKMKDLMWLSATCKSKIGTAPNFGKLGVQFANFVRDNGSSFKQHSKAMAILESKIEKVMKMLGEEFGLEATFDKEADLWKKAINKERSNSNLMLLMI